MKIKILLLAIGFLGVYQAIGQTGKFLNSDYYLNFIPKNPEGSSLGSFGNIPVNYYTGLPEVSLPLMNIKGRELDVPVTLNYDASGVRTDEFSGPVGMKWNLNAGGSVIRVLNGLPDEHPTLGYWKWSAETNYYEDLDEHEWVGWSQRNERDCEFDEFQVNINGRSIKFVFNKNKQRITVPRQNVVINYTLLNNKIDKFEVTTEDGMKYVFGGKPTAVEERKLETLNIGFAFDYTPINKNGSIKYLFNGGEKYADQVTTREKVIDFYNSKWHLVAIVAPTGEKTTFAYKKNSTNLKYVSRPSSIRVKPMMTILPTYSYVETRCVNQCPFFCCDEDDFTIGPFTNLPAIIKFPKTDPGSPCNGTCPTTYFEPDKHYATPGSSNMYHTLVTESNISLDSITAVTGSKIIFTSSSRTDFLSSVKYDLINLYNVSNALVKSIKLNYSTQNAAEGATDYMWLSEALMLKRTANWKTTGPDFYAYHVKAYTDIEIPDVLLRKYVYEGLKDYNYKRLFLESIDDLTNSIGILTTPLRLYEFIYKDRNLLKRRTTPLHDGYGYTRTNGGTTVEDYLLAAGTPPKNAKINNAKGILLSSDRAPITGMLEKIKYPTAGFTKFTYTTTNSAVFKLQLVEDVDENNTTVTQREIEYLSSAINSSPIYTSYEDFKIWGTEDWMKYAIVTTAPQNSSYSLTHGVVEGNNIVKSYFGTKVLNNGYEWFDFYSPYDSNYKDIPSDLTSDPSTAPDNETNSNGSPIRNIFPFPKHRERDYLRGFLEKSAVYKKTGATPIKETIYTYTTNPNAYVASYVRGFKGGSFNYATHSHIDAWRGFEVDAETRYRYTRYSLAADWIVLDNVKEVTYDQTDALKKQTQVTTYVYDPTYLQIVQTKKFDENFPAETIINKTKYVTHSDYIYPKSCYTTYNTCVNACQDDANCFSQCLDQLNICLNDAGSTETAAIVKLTKSNQISTPVETQTWVEQNGATRLISAVAYKYKKWGTSSFVKPVEVWGLRRSLQSSEYSESIVDNNGAFILDNSKLRKLHTFNSYDLSYAHIAQQTSFDGTVTTYQWDPATHSMVLNYTVNPGSAQYTFAYSHIPFVGINSATDPNGVVTSFQYDALRRLRLTKDNNNNIINRYRYHYISDGENATPDFTVIGDLYVGSTVMFSTPYSINGFGSNTYTWKYGDGTETSGGSTAGSKNYASPGVYTVYLSITNPERSPITVSKQITIHPQLNVSFCVDGPTKFQKSTGSVFVYGNCSPHNNNTPTSTTIFKSTVVGGCPTTTYTYLWEFQRQSSCTGTDPWVSLGSSTQATAPPAFINRSLEGCTSVNFNVRLTVTDQCGKSVTTSPFQLSIF